MKIQKVLMQFPVFLRVPMIQALFITYVSQLELAALGHFTCETFPSLLKQKIKLRDRFSSTLTPLLCRPISPDLTILFYAENESKTAISWFKPK